MSYEIHADLGTIAWSKSWYLSRSDRGEALFSSGQFNEAAAVFQQVLECHGEIPSTVRFITMIQLARCFSSMGQSTQAETIIRHALNEVDQLEKSKDVRRLIGSGYIDLGNVLRVRGYYSEARDSYEASLAINEELTDMHGAALTNFQLGTLALMQASLPEAEQRYRASLNIFSSLDDPKREATAWHQLGMVLQLMRRHDEAEAAYRESARIKEYLGMTLDAAQTWTQLAQLLHLTGKHIDADRWYRKSLAVTRNESDWPTTARTLNNLASLLATHLFQLSEARTYAEEALAIREILDPASAEIWTTLSILADIEEREGQQDAARMYRQRARKSFAASPHARETQRRSLPIILAILDIVADPTKHPHPRKLLQEMGDGDWNQITPALLDILDGNRDADTLCEPLNWQDSVIVSTILRALDDPLTLAPLQSTTPPDDGAANTE